MQIGTCGSEYNFQRQHHTRILEVLPLDLKQVRQKGPRCAQGAALGNSRGAPGPESAGARGPGEAHGKAKVEKANLAKCNIFHVTCGFKYLCVPTLIS